MISKISIIGGDLRLVKLSEMLLNEGAQVYTYGLENADNVETKKCDSIEETINFADIIIGPIPFSSNGETINTPFGKEKINLEELSVLNAISTAEGAIKIAIEETPKNIHGSNILVMGFGRIGKVLSHMLNGLGAKVSCEARKTSDLAWIKAYGYDAVPLSDLNDNLYKYDIIINTIPYMVLDRDALNNVKSDALVIDLASNPGGVDKNAIKEMKIKFVWALSLPGKISPVTSAEFIKETLYNVVKELEN